MSALDVQTCLGLPNQRMVSGKTTLLTYYTDANKTFGLLAGVATLSMGGYCHATVRIDDDRVAFSGDTSSLLSHDATCASIVRTCLSAEFRKSVERASSGPRTGRNKDGRP